MRLTQLYVRFFRSFNYDYERKANAKAKPRDWEEVDGAWYPFVRVPLESDVTAVVGANESGKSHLIGALSRALTGDGIDRKDFCRYSRLYSVETDQMRIPDFGVEARVESQIDRDVAGSLGVESDRLTLLRMGTGERLIIDGDGEPRALGDEELNTLEAVMPLPFVLETDIPIPDSLSLDTLVGREQGPLSRRRSRAKVFEVLSRLRGTAEEDPSALGSEIANALNQGAPGDDEIERKRVLSEQLGRRLLTEVAQIGEEAFVDLEAAFRDEEEGRVGGILQKMNASLAAHLNFARWWRQDLDFQLRLSPRERELAFTIRDRTGTDYSFSERSRGLMYFLSYYVQLRAHQPPTDRAEVLLMDEPDAYLSSLGQQDLLRTLENFARPDDGARRDQVVYVTHSPFLINKNYAHRIRVLDKGSSEEGTRVVRDVARNHYEPLRSSIGSFVAETAFIGGANLLVEGVSDQVLIAGVDSLLRQRDLPRSKLLDLNEITIVPAGGASSVPYMAYLARGRDERKPACVALLDGDADGKDAAKKLRKSEVDGRQVISEENLVVLSEWADTNSAELKLHEKVRVTEIEDLIPPTLAAAAANAYAKRLLRLGEDHATLNESAIVSYLSNAKPGLWEAVTKAFSATFDGAHIDKVGFTKELVLYLDGARHDRQRPGGAPNLEHNFGLLIADLADRLHRAEGVEAELRRNKQLNRLTAGFVRDYPDGATRDNANQTLRDIGSKLDDSDGDDAVRSAISKLRRDFDLSSDPLSPVPDFNDFRDRLEQLPVQARRPYQDPAAP